jgi:uncharacterized protein YdbL (DUF1318 family)
MPIEREPDKILALPDQEFFQWRGDARQELAQRSDARLPALYQVSGQELVNRAARAWAARRGQ